MWIPHVCCSAVLHLSMILGCFCPTLPSLYFMYCISVAGALFPLCVGTHGWVARICQPWEQSHPGAGCQQWKLLDVWGTQPPFGDATVNLWKTSLFSLVLLAALGLLVPFVHFRNKILSEAYSASFTLCFLLSVPFRLELHKRLLLPQNRPLLRSSNKYLFNNEQQQGNVSSGIN